MGPCITSDITAMKTLWPSASWKAGSVRIDDVVAQADEVDGGSVAVPAEEPVVRRQDDREDDEGDEDEQSRSDQDRELEPGSPSCAAGAPAGGAPADGRRPDGGSVCALPPSATGVPGTSSAICEESRTVAIRCPPQDFAAASFTASTMPCGVALAGEHVDHRDVQRVADVLAVEGVEPHRDVRCLVVRLRGSPGGPGR